VRVSIIVSPKLSGYHLPMLLPESSIKPDLRLSLLPAQADKEMYSLKLYALKVFLLFSVLPCVC